MELSVLQTRLQNIYFINLKKINRTTFGYPLLSDEAAEIIIPFRNHPNAIVEVRSVDTVWEEESVFLVSMRDVTERRNMEEQLRIGEENIGV